MKYQFTNKEVKAGDYCIFVWKAEDFAKEFNESPKGKPGETTFGPWTNCDYGSIANLPVVVDEVTKEYIMLRPFMFDEDGKHCHYIYSKGHPEPLSIQLVNTDKVFPRLIKSQWALPNNFEEKLDKLADEFSEDEPHPERVYYGYTAGYKQAVEDYGE